MKGYLLLEDGSIFFGKTVGKENLLGEISINGQDSIKIQCQITGKNKFVANTKSNLKNGIILSNIDFESLKQKIKKSKKLQAKIVTDSLPIQFHMYDLKTFIPIV
ncbi:hypothetical protein SAMN02745883_00903 [Caminicella sporogenes DSM 14501]|uniref:Uncharacterized protein n=1 Tax=Caminicella sporogenes DSM 14501 TaxID=1121266 RepID=A0A1M6NJ20_9FIRM|nr:hypothetical protein [Caminicella sporogenes]RKD22185.1 hypothetical protein BET04_06075 [Caminicella sporogenes]WIF95804.1 hypothetical protein QNI18_04095 [Caminicella sporogenes]SHJ95687.1 hypothetical protein SAMN02745883_00903 [Caminicella sporogenes DSM 14501]